MIKVSEQAAANRARTTAGRRAQIAERLERLRRGEYSTAQDVQRARQRSSAQALALSTSRERLLIMLRSAAARHAEEADRLTREGRTEEAARARTHAKLRYDAVDRFLGATHGRSASPSLHHPLGPLGPLGPAGARAGANDGEEAARLRHAVAALLSWAGGADLDDMDRRLTWGRSIVQHCAAPGWHGWIRAVCTAAVESLPALRGVAITVVGGSSAEFVAASDPWTSTVQELELIVGEGPATTAHEEDRIVLVTDMADGGHAWQGYASSAAWAHQVRGVCALPLRVQDLCVGVMALYYRTPITERNHVDLADARAFTDIAAAALFADLEEVRLGGSIGTDRFIMHVAAGAMAGRLDITVPEAEARIRAYAFSSGMSLAQAAEQILHGEPGLA